MSDVHVIHRQWLHDAQLKQQQKTHRDRDHVNRSSLPPRRSPINGENEAQSRKQALERGVPTLTERNRGLAEDSLLFAQLLEESASGQRDGGGESGGQEDGDAALFGGATATITSNRLAAQLGQALAPCLEQAAEGPLDVVLCLPKLGNINVKAQRSRHTWDIALSAEQEETRSLLETHRHHCEQALSRTLDIHVALHVVGCQQYYA